MKKRHLKQWVVNTLIIINFIAIMFMGADCDDMTLFISSKLIALLIFAFNNVCLKFSSCNNSVIFENSRVPKYVYIKNIPIKNPKSPIRFTINAFFPADAFSASSYQ